MWGYEKDQIERHAILMYDLDDEKRTRYEHLCRVFEQLAAVGRVWHISAKRVPSREGSRATTTIARSQIFPTVGPGPTHLKTNVPVAGISVGSQALYFLPDRVLVQAPEGYGAVSYPNLELSISRERTAEHEELPSDATVVGQTWAFTNTSGEPDRRYKNNREIPIVVYERIHFTSTSGLNELIQYSCTGVGDQIRKALLDLNPDLSRQAEEQEQATLSRFLAEKNKEKAMSEPKSLRAVFQEYVESGQVSGPARSIANFLASGAKSRAEFAKFVSAEHLSSESDLKGILLDLVVIFTYECTKDHELSREELDELVLLTEMFEIQEGEFFKWRQADVQNILESQARWILEDRYVTEREEILQRDLQRVFGLSYDQYVAMVRPLVKAYIDELSAKKAVAQEQRQSIELSIRNLRGVFLIPE